MKTLCFDRYVKMSPGLFQHLLCVVGPKIAKKDTRLRKAIKRDERFFLLNYIDIRLGQKNLKTFKNTMDSAFI